MTIELNLSEASIDEAIRQVNEYTEKVKENTKELAIACADKISNLCTIELTGHVEAGETLETLRTDTVQRADAVSTFTTRVLCGGAAIWLEFGTGVISNPAAGVGGYAHPKAAELGMYGIGEYGLGHGSDPNGWWYYDENHNKRHTYGIPATMFMYHSAWGARRELPSIARGVFGT